jgi:flagellar basal body-associated protein FliL
MKNQQDFNKKKEAMERDSQTFWRIWRFIIVLIVTIIAAIIGGLAIFLLKFFCPGIFFIIYYGL